MLSPEPDALVVTANSSLSYLFTYFCTGQERSEYELLLEKENKELKEDLKEMKKKAVDSESRLNTVKTFCELTTRL